MRLFLVLTSVFLLLFCGIAAAEEEALEWNGFYYKVLSDGTAEITGHSGLDRNLINIMTGKDRRIKELNIPSHVNGIPVSRIANLAFGNSTSLKKVSISEGITGIGIWAFNYSNIETLILPDSLRRIEEHAFLENVNLKDFRMPENLEYIGQNAFWGCDRLTKVTIPDSVSYIGESAFAFCEQLKEVSIGAGVEFIGYSDYRKSNENPFNGWNKLSVIRVSGENPNFRMMDGCLIDVRDMKLIAYPQEKKDKVFTVPEGIEIIGHDAFSRADDLEKLILPDSVHTIEGFAISHMERLREIVCGSGLKTIEDYGIGTVQALEKLTLPAEVEFIGEEVVYSQKEVTVYLPWECDAAAWARGQGFKVEFTQADVCRILTPAAGASVSLTDADELLIEWMPYPGADEYEINLSFQLEGGDALVTYPTLYVDGRTDEDGLCRVEISPTGIFHEMWKAAGGPYVYLSWQAKADITAYAYEN